MNQSIRVEMGNQGFDCDCMLLKQLLQTRTKPGHTLEETKKVWETWKVAGNSSSL